MDHSPSPHYARLAQSALRALARLLARRAARLPATRSLEPGQWGAYTGQSLVATGDTAERALTGALDAGHQSVLLQYGG